MMRRRRRFHHGRAGGALYLEDERFARWTLRALVLGGAHLRWQVLDTDSLIAVAQLPEPSATSLRSPTGILRYLRRHLEAAEARRLGPAGPIHVNAGKLVERLGMGPVERDLIALAMLAHLGSGLSELLAPLIVGAPRRFAEILAATLGGWPGSRSEAAAASGAPSGRGRGGCGAHQRRCRSTRGE